MKTKLLLSLLLSFYFYLLSSQIPQGFNYQAIARDGSGNPIANATIMVKLSILSDTTGFYASGGGTYVWEEEQTNIKINAFGLFTVVFGNPLATKVQGSAASFSAIDWAKTPLFIGTKIANPTSYKNMGSAKLWAVPYSMVTDSTKALLKGSKLSVVSNNDLSTDALFEVKRKDGQTVFAVYPDAVNIYVPRTAKGTKGGFAIGGFDQVKTGPQDYFRVTPDSVRIYIDKTPTIVKGATKGGFAIGGFDQVKGGVQDLLTVGNDSIRMYINDSQAKGVTKGGFAIGGFNTAKGTNSNFFNVETSSSGIINPSQNRVLWYPIKNAFLAGRVKIEKPDSVGVNSFATGYESKAKGQYSQAMGYQTISRGNYSTAIGNNAVAAYDNSFAFGNQARAMNTDSYAFGTGAKATGKKSFALGSSQVNDSTGSTVQTIASGEGAFALGFGSVASAQGAFAMGVLDTASGPFSLAMGYYTKSQGLFSTTLGAGTIVEPTGWNGMATGFFTKAGNWAASAFGDKTYASGHTSFATGYSTTASGHLSTTFGEQTTASGRASMAMGQFTTAQALGSFVLGRYNVISGTTTTWYDTEPAIVVGNGTSTSSRSNSFTLYKNGNLDIAGTINKTLIFPEAVEINYGATGNRFSYIDFHSDDTYSDFSFRILRNTGVNASTDMIHRGTGNFDIITQESSPLVFSTSNAERMRIKSNGFVGINTSNPIYMLDIGGSVNLNKGISGIGAMYVNGSEALWYDGTLFSWGYGGGYNGFARPTSIGTTGNPGAYWLYVAGNAYSAGSFISGSDIRWKKNIVELGSVLDKVTMLNGVSYEWKNDEFPEIHFDSGIQIGLIAQDVEEIFPELVKTDDKGFKGVNYDKLSVLLLEGIKDQQKIITGQQETIKSLKVQLSNLEEKVNRIEALLSNSGGK